MPVLRQRPGKGQSSNAFVAYKASGIREMAVTDPVGEYPQSTQKPYTDETTHVIFKLLEFIPKLAVLVPKLRVNLTRFHGVFALNSKQRIDVTPVKHGKGRANQENE